MDAYPEAKIVLTVRNPTTWYASVRGSIFQSSILVKNPIVRTFLTAVGKLHTLETVVNLCSFNNPSIKSGQTGEFTSPENNL